MTLDELSECCGSSAWAAAMFALQPFADKGAIHAAADEIWWSLTREDWLEAFLKHPKIGEASTARWTMEEQGGMAGARHAAVSEISRLNTEYYSRFGFIFIVCARGKSADEMLDLLRLRSDHSLEQEITIAAAEQAKITHLRLDKLVTR